MSDTISPLMVAQIALSQLAAFLSLLLGASAVHKLRDRVRTAMAIGELTGVPPSVATIAVPVLAAAEIAAGIALWMPSRRCDAALLAAAVWAGYLLFLARAVAVGRSELDCGCSFGSSRHALGAFEVGRAALLVALAFLVAAGAAIGPGAIAYATGIAALATQLLAAVALLALYAAADQLRANAAPLRGAAA